MKIEFYRHAEHKFDILAEHGFPVDRSQVVGIVENPARVLPGRQGRKIAEAPVSETHKLRVVFEDRGGTIQIVTFYPRRIGQ